MKYDGFSIYCSLGGAIAAAVGGFAVLLALILILVYLVRARRR